MDGLGLLLKALGVEINPDEIKQAVDSAKILIPKIAQSFDEMNERLKRVEQKLDNFIVTKSSPDIDAVKELMIHG